MRSLAAIICICYLLTSTVQAQQGWAAYTHTLAAHRKHKDAELKNSEQSPFKKSGKAFKKLHYFKPDSTYRVQARLERLQGQLPFKMPATGNKLQTYVAYGRLHFTLAGQQLTAMVYQNLDLIARDSSYRNYIPLFFKDTSNGKATYGGGRYLELHIPAGDTLVVDFNYAYNPYCAYSDHYSCPIPPKENHLPVAILAGERKYH